MKAIPVLYTARCVLSTVTSADILVLCQILDDADTRRFLPELCEVFQTEGSLKQFIASFDKYLQQNEGILWGIRKEDTFIGFIAIMDTPDNPTLFYAMHPAYRNQGLMKESLVKTEQYICENKVCQMISSEAYYENTISKKLLRDIGLQVYKEDGCKSYYFKEIKHVSNQKSIID